MTTQCNELGKECKHRFVCPPVFKAKQPDSCSEYLFDEEWNRNWT